jgi:hypothetical protein
VLKVWNEIAANFPPGVRGTGATGRKNEMVQNVPRDEGLGDAVKKLLATGFAAAMLMGLGVRCASADTVWAIYDAQFGYWTDSSGTPYGGAATPAGDGGYIVNGSTFTLSSNFGAVSGADITTMASNQDGSGIAGNTYTGTFGSSTNYANANGINVELLSDNHQYMLDLFIAGDLTKITTPGTVIPLCTAVDALSKDSCSGIGDAATTEWYSASANGTYDSLTYFDAPTRSLGGAAPNQPTTYNVAAGNPCGDIAGPCLVYVRDPPPANVPEPATLPLMITALAGLGFVTWRRRIAA